VLDSLFARFAVIAHHSDDLALIYAVEAGKILCLLFGELVQ
jgi:hypothetical protein